MYVCKYVPYMDPVGYGFQLHLLKSDSALWQEGKPKVVSWRKTPVRPGFRGSYRLELDIVHGRLTKDLDDSTEHNCYLIHYCSWETDSRFCALV